jgi:enoyl-CoA hydratase/carnithine racemase
MTDTILYSRKGHIGRVVLNNPDRHNALGREQIDALQKILCQVESDPQVRVLLLTGAGPKTFCAGATLEELQDGSIGNDALQVITSQLAALSIPTLCAVKGDVFGGGVELALSCDFRIGIPGTHMRVPAASIGLCYPLSGLTRFVERLGVQMAKRILVASEKFDAQQLLELGFYDHLVAPEEFEQFGNDYASHIAGLAPLAVRSMKAIIDQVAAGAVDASAADKLSRLCLESQDLQEGFAAKKEKRNPRFSGR